MYSLNAGRLRKKVDIYGYQEMDSELGGKKVVLAKRATVWAELRRFEAPSFWNIIGKPMLCSIRLRFGTARI